MFQLSGFYCNMELMLASSPLLRSNVQGAFKFEVVRRCNPL